MRGDLEKLLADKDDATIRNNLGFCQIISGEIVKGLENINRAIAHEYAPLFEMNKGIANYLVNGPEEAKKSLRNALKELQTPGNSYEPDASYLLVLDSDGKKVTAHPDLLIEAAIFINLWRMGDVPRSELETELTRLAPEKTKALLEQLV